MKRRCALSRSGSNPHRPAQVPFRAAQVLTRTGHGVDATHGHGSFTVVGGTDRFQGATGSYEQTVTFAVAPGSSTSDSIAFTDVLEGLLTPLGSNQ
jgi:hypothetical protein